MRAELSHISKKFPSNMEKVTNNSGFSLGMLMLQKRSPSKIETNLPTFYRSKNFTEQTKRRFELKMPLFQVLMEPREIKNSETPKKASKGRRGRWKYKEDELLQESVKDLGKNWAKVAAKVGRNPQSCKKRFLRLTSLYSKSEWTEKEDYQLCLAAAALGCKWGHVSRHFPGKSRAFVKQRFNEAMKLKKVRKKFDRMIKMVETRAAGGKDIKLSEDGFREQCYASLMYVHLTWKQSMDPKRVSLTSYSDYFKNPIFLAKNFDDNAKKNEIEDLSEICEIEVKREVIDLS